jgi:NADH-quinone oxidoreductase subunit L
MSQIGYMMLAAGIGPAGYAFAIFHLLTHGFFKANMFLGAGSVMHGMGDDVNMRHYGGLAKVMRITFLTFGMGYLAIIGFPFFSGFYSKDHIIEAAWEAQPVLGILALIGAGVTAFYMTRLMLMTFFGEKRWREGVHPHESPVVMWIPLVLLAIGSIIGGMALNAWIGGWLAPIGAEAPENLSWLPHWSLIGIVTLVVVAAGVALSWLVFGRKAKPVPDEAPEKVSIITTIGRHDLYGDAINNAVFVTPSKLLGKGVALLDEKAIDPATEAGANAVSWTGNKVRTLQNGYVRSYGLTMAVGVILIGAALILSQLV